MSEQQGAAGLHPRHSQLCNKLRPLPSREVPPPSVTKSPCLRFILWLDPCPYLLPSTPDFPYAFQLQPAGRRGRLRPGQGPGAQHLAHQPRPRVRALEHAPCADRGMKSQRELRVCEHAHAKRSYLLASEYLCAYLSCALSARPLHPLRLPCLRCPCRPPGRTRLGTGARLPWPQRCRSTAASPASTSGAQHARGKTMCSVTAFKYCVPAVRAPGRPLRRLLSRMPAVGFVADETALAILILPSWCTVADAFCYTIIAPCPHCQVERRR